MYRSSLCNICKSPEHNALDCPFSWLRELDEVQHAIDQEQRQNDLELLPTETNSTQASANIPDPVNDTEMTNPSYVDLSHTEPSQAEASENPSEEFLSADDTDEDLSEMDDSAENTPQLFDNSAPSLPATQPALRQQAGKITNTSAPLRIPTRPVLVLGRSLSADDRPNSQSRELSDTENSEPAAKRKPNGQRTPKHKKRILFY